MYIFKSGKFEGKTMEEVILRNPSALYGLVAWAENKLILPKMRSHFGQLRKKLKRAHSVKKCYEPRCKRRARWLTLPYSYPEGLLPRPYYWCERHSPHEKEGISDKMRIHFDVIRLFKDQGGQKEMGKCVRHALGIKKGLRITEDFAIWFFEQELETEPRAGIEST